MECAQAHSLASSPWDTTNYVLVAGSVLIAMVMGLGLFLLWVRKRSLSRQDTGSAGIGIDQLEAMRQSGLMTDEEFRKLRRKALRVDTPGVAEKALSPDAKPDDGKEGPPLAGNDG